MKSTGILRTSLKMKSSFKSTGKSLNFTIFVGLYTVFRDLNQHKSVEPLFGAACAAPNKGITVS